MQKVRAGPNVAGSNKVRPKIALPQKISDTALVYQLSGRFPFRAC